jgi:hypothetical protein
MKTAQSTPQDSLVQRLLACKSLLTTAELMELLSRNRATVCSWCRQGKIPHFRLPDQSYMFDPVLIAGWLMDRFIA